MGKEKEFVLVMKARKLTENQLYQLALQGRKEVKRLAPGRRAVFGIEEKEPQLRHGK